MGGGAFVPAVSGRLTRTISLDDDVASLRYVSKGRREALERMGITRVRDLLLSIPHRYLDFTHATDIAHADMGLEVTIVGTVDKVTLKRPRPRLQIVEIYVIDETGVLRASFFKQPWIAEQVKQGDRVALSGKVGFAYGFKEMRSPFLERLDESDQGGVTRIIPVHHVSEGLSAPWMRRIMSAALADSGDVLDFLPVGLVCDHHLMTLARALREVHFPHSLASAEQARRRLAYDELFCLQITLLARQHLELAGASPTRHATDGAHLHAVLAALPFELTEEQQQAVDEILADMASPHAMNRLLLGDVGTGKTAVATVACASVADTGTQAAVMAPTSVLAAQYAEKMGPVLDAAKVSWTLITGSTSPADREQRTASIARGTTCVIFGTTALLSDDVRFKNLTLVVIDEQHRFGVSQRAALREKGAAADLLAMTATPIPRTLALSLYGDMDISRIAHRPRAGAGVSTTSIAPENLDIAYGAIRDAVTAGYQAYIVCPLIDDADDGSSLEDIPQSARSGARKLHSAQASYEELSHQTLSGISMGLLTGRMAPAEKESVMSDFRAGKISVLVSTTVIEVGVDVPNATVMLVYDADRFGLATLHQLRGRVGRGDMAGTVYLECAAKQNTPARRRLDALEATSDGFKLAELDLKLRHEGEVLGYRQSGGVSLHLADLSVDKDLVSWAHDDARHLADEDPALAKDVHRPLEHEVGSRFGIYFEEVERA